MTHYVLIFVAGIAGSFHCIGMCGGFACALGRDCGRRTATVERHLLYNTGRLMTYAFIGGLAGSLGHALVGHDVSGSLTEAQRVLALASGLLMVVMAVQFFGYLGRFHRGVSGFGGATLAVSLGSLLSAPGRSAPLAFGVFNGFLPCPLVYAFAAQAAATGDVLQGLLTMVAFGLGTFPAMLMMGGIGGLLRPVWRRRGVRVAGGFILVLGLLTVARGVVPLHAHGQASHLARAVASWFGW
jgi:sulfite exporter TauE/SafE